MDNVKQFTEEELWQIISEEYEGALIVEDYADKEDWWIYHEIIFNYDGIQYFFIYKEHVSPNISHNEIVKGAEPVQVQPVTINSEDEARYIWRELMKMGKEHISVEDILDVTNLQYDYLVKMGVVK